MKQLTNLVPFPHGAESNPFFAALATVLLPALGFSEKTPYYCAPKGTQCVHCGGCGDSTTLQKLHDAVYRDLQTISGVSFGWAWPEQDSAYHTLDNAGPTWNWPDTFIDFLMRYAGLSWQRLSPTGGREAAYAAITASIDRGLPVMMRRGGAYWQVVAGYDEGTLCGLVHACQAQNFSQNRRTDTGGVIWDDWFEAMEDAFVITGHNASTVTFPAVVARILSVLEQPAHERLEQDIVARIEGIAPENALETARFLKNAADFPIEARWHAAEAFSSGDAKNYGLLRLAPNAAVRNKLGEIFFSYIADNHDETHGVCWKIWGLLGVGPDSGYRLAPDVEQRLLCPETQAELKRLFTQVFHNDRAVRDVLRAVQGLM